MYVRVISNKVLKARRLTSAEFFNLFTNLKISMKTTKQIFFLQFNNSNHKNYNKIKTEIRQNEKIKWEHQVI